METLLLVECQQPDLLLLDLKMPGKTGHEVLQAIKADEKMRKIPVAVLTSSDRDEDIARSYGLGGNHFLTRPGDPPQLELRLRNLLKNLPEMAGIRRGAGEVQASAVVAEGPRSFLWRTLFNWIAILVLLLALAAFGLWSGALRS